MGHGHFFKDQVFGNDARSTIDLIWASAELADRGLCSSAQRQWLYAADYVPELTELDLGWSSPPARETHNKDRQKRYWQLCHLLGRERRKMARQEWRETRGREGRVEAATNVINNFWGLSKAARKQELHSIFAPTLVWAKGSEHATAKEKSTTRPLSPILMLRRKYIYPNPVDMLPSISPPKFVAAIKTTAFFSAPSATDTLNAALERAIQLLPTVLSFVNDS
ncbi:hypothetical protein NUU61_001347 [Penicillium alfredii]|uniref:Uncharacterized protein n=1 Tax=Penicillium alfredii TaxID=1506179 RepID=A0A9W9G484_9EURO|nr:uncharacterized protein NUU61_001347 [Penicillium alfredii]KAJ5111717.1 hypothetical protein NUU61_001347 [Penicillium alfredii]